MIQVTITSARQLAGIAAAANAAGAASGEAYLQGVVEAACESYRDQFAVDRIPSSDFILRFPPAAFAAIQTAAATDEVVAGFIVRVKAEPYVWLASDEVAQGVAYLVANALLTEAEAEALLAYAVPAPVVEPAPVEPPANP